VGLAYAVHAAAFSEITIPHPGSLTIGHSPPEVTSTGIVMPLALTPMTDTTRESSRRWMGFKSNTRAAVTAGLGDEERAPAKRRSASAAAGVDEVGTRAPPSCNTDGGVRRGSGGDAPLRVGLIPMKSIDEN
jgi:hypothetical protein